MQKGKIKQKSIKLMIYYLDWRNCLATLHTIISKLFGTANKYLYAAVPSKAHNLWHVVQYQSSINKSTQFVACSSILKFNQQKHTTRGM